MGVNNLASWIDNILAQLVQPFGIVEHGVSSFQAACRFAALEGSSRQLTLFRKQVQTFPCVCKEKGSLWDRSRMS